MLLLSTILTLFSSVHTLRLTEEIFYKADTLLYTPELRSSLQANDFLQSIRPLESAAESAKSKAFKTLFDACRGQLLYDGRMGKNVIVPMVDTGNTEYLPLLLDRGTIKKGVGEESRDYPNQKHNKNPIPYCH